MQFGYAKVDRRGLIMLTFRPAIGERKCDSEKETGNGTFVIIIYFLFPELLKLQWNETLLWNRIILFSDLTGFLMCGCLPCQ